jgi:MFS family permease
VYGLLTAVFGTGALIGALVSASFGRATWRILLASAAAFGIGELVLAPQRSVVGASLLLLLTGVAYTLYTSNTNALVQLAAPSHLQGRIAGLYSYIFSASNPLGALLVGALAEAGGTQLAFLVGGAAAVVSAAFGMTMKLRLPSLRVSPDRPATRRQPGRVAPPGDAQDAPEPLVGASPERPR